MSLTPSRRGASRRSLLAGLGAAAAGLSFTSLEGCAPKGKIGANGEELKLNLYNWDTYTGKTTLADFKAATGIEVKMSLFATNDELFAKLKAGNPGFDVIVPSNEYVTRFRIADLLMELDLAKIPNRVNLLPAFQDPPFDPGRHYSMPYTWLLLGIGFGFWSTIPRIEARTDRFRLLILGRSLGARPFSLLVSRGFATQPSRTRPSTRAATIPCPTPGSCLASVTANPRCKASRTAGNG